MILVDVNVLVYAHREDCERHGECRRWIEDLWESQSAYGVSEVVLNGCLRVLTHPRVFDPPTPLSQAIAYVSQIRGSDNAVVVAPGDRHWKIFLDLCTRTGGIRWAETSPTLSSGPDRRREEPVGHCGPDPADFCIRSRMR